MRANCSAVVLDKRTAILKNMRSDSTPQQLPLPVRLRLASVFNGFYAGPNHLALQALQTIASGSLAGCDTPIVSPIVFLYGATGVGKTHLLQALCAQVGTQKRMASYLPLRELHRYGAELLSGTQTLDVLCLDDVGCIAEQREWNLALFNLHREFDERGAKLVLADTESPAQLPFVLPDLKSRIMAGALLRLQPLDDAQRIEALRLHAQQRGFELPEEVGSYLLRRLPRDMHGLCQFIDELDVALLAAQRRLSVPFVRTLLLD